jgi:hypothetical protein
VGARRKSRAERCFSGRPNEGSIKSNNLGSNPPLSKQVRISEIDSIFDMLRLVPGLWRGLMLERVKRNFNRQVYAEVLLQEEVNL